MDTTTEDADTLAERIYQSPLFPAPKDMMKITDGIIDVEIPAGEILYLRLLDVDEDTVRKVTLTADSTDINNTYEFTFNSPLGTGFYFVL